MLTGVQAPPVRSLTHEPTNRDRGVRAVAGGPTASIAAAVVHYRLLSDPLYRSVCDFNATWNCTQVYQSQYGHSSASRWPSAA